MIGPPRLPSSIASMSTNIDARSTSHFMLEAKTNLLSSSHSTENRQPIASSLHSIRNESQAHKLVIYQMTRTVNDFSGRPFHRYSNGIVSDIMARYMSRL